MVHILGQMPVKEDQLCFRLVAWYRLVPIRCLSQCCPGSLSNVIVWHHRTTIWVKPVSRWKNAPPHDAMIIWILLVWLISFRDHCVCARPIEGRRYSVTLSLIFWAQAQNDSCSLRPGICIGMAANYLWSVWFGQWIGTVWWQSVAWANIDPGVYVAVWRHQATMSWNSMTYLKLLVGLNSLAWIITCFLFLSWSRYRNQCWLTVKWMPKNKFHC